MARIRQIKPEFFSAADLVELSAFHRLMFIGMWCFADKAGRLEDKPKDIRLRILPLDDCDSDAILGDLDRAGFIVRYEVNGRKLIQIRNFAKHQHFHKNETESKLPAPPYAETVSTEAAESLIGSNSGACTMPAPESPPRGTAAAPEYSARDQGLGIRDQVLPSEGSAPAQPGQPKPKPARPPKGPAEFWEWARAERVSVLGPTVEPDSMTKANWPRLGEILKAQGTVRLQAGYRNYLTQDWARSKDPPWPMALFLSDTVWPKCVSAAARIGPDAPEAQLAPAERMKRALQAQGKQP